MITDKVAIDVRQLSSGTIATISGLTRYEDIDSLREQFYNYTADRPGRFDTWVDAWKAFSHSCELNGMQCGQCRLRQLEGLIIPVRKKTEGEATWQRL